MKAQETGINPSVIVANTRLTPEFAPASRNPTQITTNTLVIPQAKPNQPALRASVTHAQR